jgi:hypothetical protein
MKNIYAYTYPTPKVGYAGYISVNQRESEVEFSVRSEDEHIKMGLITLSLEQCEDLAIALLRHVDVNR